MTGGGSSTADLAGRPTESRWEGARSLDLCRGHSVLALPLSMIARTPLGRPSAPLGADGMAQSCKEFATRRRRPRRRRDPWC